MIADRRQRSFGTKRAAYVAADVNSATWDRAERGEAIRGDRLRQIVRTLWPETDGDPTLVLSPVGHSGHDRYVAAPGETVEVPRAVLEDIMRAIEEMRADIRGMKERDT